MWSRLDEYAGAQWIHNNSKKYVTQEHGVEKYHEEKAQAEQHRLLAEGGFGRVADNIIALMDGYNGVGSWNPWQGRYHTNTKKAQQLTDFCKYLQSDAADKYVEQIMKLESAVFQAAAFTLLYEMSKSDRTGSDALDRLLSSPQSQNKMIFPTPNKDACKTHGILSIVHSLFDPAKATGSSSYNDRLAWILRKELCVARTIDDEWATKKSTHANRTGNDDSGRILGPYTEEYVVAEKTRESLTTFGKEYLGAASVQLTVSKDNVLQSRFTTQLKTIRIQPELAKTGTEEKLESAIVSIDLDQEVSIRKGGLGSFGFGWTRFFNEATHTKLTLRKYLASLSVSDDASKEKFIKIMAVLEDPNQPVVDVSKLKEALSDYRCENKREKILVKRENLNALEVGLWHTNQTTGEKILDALLKLKQQEKEAQSVAAAASERRFVQQ